MTAVQFLKQTTTAPKTENDTVVLDPRCIAVIDADKTADLLKTVASDENVSAIVLEAAQYAYDPDVVLGRSIDNIRKLPQNTLNTTAQLSKKINALWPGSSYIEVFTRFAGNIASVAKDQRHADEIEQHALGYYMDVRAKAAWSQMEMGSAIRGTADEIVKRAQDKPKTQEAVDLIVKAHQDAIQAQIPIEEERSREAWELRRKPIPGMHYLD